mmetsp:Transcript_55238/g.117433  ORF Transcript_55238/g.117433 Transcript_55238/m.117433 type:complete len:98 (-) Transcript_55238:1816-2109(-)
MAGGAEGELKAVPDLLAIVGVHDAGLGGFVVVADIRCRQGLVASLWRRPSPTPSTKFMRWPSALSVSTLFDLTAVAKALKVDNVSNYCQHLYKGNVS